jgi:hypothetical protein
MNATKDSVLTGALCGLLFPVLAFTIYSLIKFDDYNPLQVFNRVLELKILAPIMSLALIINLAIFFLFIFLKFDQSARGVLLATFMYGAFIVYLKLF